MTDEIARVIAKEQIVYAIFDKLLEELIERIVNEEKDYIPLSESAKEQVRFVLDENEDLDEVFVNGFNVEMSRKKLLCLRRTEWLNDEVGLCHEVIHYYANRLSTFILSYWMIDAECIQRNIQSVISFLPSFIKS